MGVDLNDYYSRRQGRSGMGRFLGQFLFFLASLIPMCILAWKMDVAGIFGQNEPREAVVAPPREPEPPRNPRVERAAFPIPPAPQPEWPQQESHGEEPAGESLEPVDPEPSPPREAEEASDPPAAEPSYVAALDLDRRRQAETVPLKSPRLDRLSGLDEDYVLEPDDGTLPATVTIRSFTAGDVLLHVDATPDGTVEIESVVKANGKEVAFTLDAMRRVQRNAAKTVQQAAAQLAAATAEHTRLQAWLDAPGGKAFTAREQARARTAALKAAIPQWQKQVAALEAELALVGSLLELAERLNGECQLHFAGGKE